MKTFPANVEVWLVTPGGRRAHVISLGRDSSLREYIEYEHAVFASRDEAEREADRLTALIALERTA